MEKVELMLKGQIYNGKLDMRSIANIQAELKKQGLKITVPEIFKAVEEQDLNITLEIVVQSILRCHKKITRTSLEDKLDLSELENMYDYIARLGEVALPKNEGKQIEE